MDVGPAMMAKILKENKQYVHWTTLCGLTTDKETSPKEIKEQEPFDASIAMKLGPCLTIHDFKDDNNIETPMYNMYADDDDGENQHAVDREDFIEGPLPRENNTISGKVKGRKQDLDGCLRGRANTNPILDT
jgi:hypothetical protein